MVDLHLHTSFSHDSKENMEDYLVLARSHGVKTLGFSEHYDYDCIVDGERIMLAPIGDYGVAVENFRKKYPDIDILKGIEFGYSAAACPEYLAVQKKYNFDYVINSVHTISKRGDCYFPRFFEGKTVIQAYSDYFDAVLESVSAPYDYEIIGHIGYVSRYCRAENPRIFYKNYKTVIDDILTAIIKRDKCMEINTSVGGSGSSFLPDKDIIERYIELGGSKFSFGSDSHRLERSMSRESEVKDYLLSLGVNKACYFKNRQCLYENLLP